MHCLCHVEATTEIKLQALTSSVQVSIIQKLLSVNPDKLSPGINYSETSLHKTFVKEIGVEPCDPIHKDGFAFAGKLGHCVVSQLIECIDSVDKNILRADVFVGLLSNCSSGISL